MEVHSAASGLDLDGKRGDANEIDGAAAAEEEAGRGQSVGDQGGPPSGAPVPEVFIIPSATPLRTSARTVASIGSLDFPHTPTKTGMYHVRGHRDSTTSIDSVALKSTPASPHVTPLNGVTCVEYVGQQSSALESVTGIIEKDTGIESVENQMNADSAPFEPEINKAQKFFSNMISSLSFRTVGASPSPTNNKGSLSPCESEEPCKYTTVTSSSLGSKATASNENKLPSENGIETNGDAVSEPHSLPTPDTNNTKKGYNKKLYEDKMLPGTNYRFATRKRNSDFHKLFDSVDADDRLLDDFSCALSREFLYQGRLYVSESYICFNSNILGWVTNLVVPIKDIVSFEKTSTAGLFPNGIALIMDSTKHYFASFLSRDSTFEFLEAVWTAYHTNSKALIKPSAYLDVPLNITGEEFFLKPIAELMQITAPPSRASAAADGNSDIQDAIMSVDYVTPSGTINGSEEFRSDAYEDTSDSDILSPSEDNGKAMNEVFHLKEACGYEYNGPYYHHETSFRYIPEEHAEFTLAELTLNAPPGVVFQLIFSEANPSFIEEFLTAQSSTNISEIPPFTEVNPEGQHYRNYTYTKALAYPVGPRSTKCVVQETVLHRDYEDYINVVNTTKTPDVPSGNSFSVKTRYMFKWESPTTSLLKVSFWVEWVGSSWIRSMVNNSCKSGQIEATKSLVSQVYRYIDTYVEQRVISVDLNANDKSSLRTAAEDDYLEAASRPRKKQLLSASSELSSSASSIMGNSAVSAASTAVSNSSPARGGSWRYYTLYAMLTAISLLLIANLILQARIASSLNHRIDLGDRVEWSASALDELADKISAVIAVRSDRLAVVPPPTARSDAATGGQYVLLTPEYSAFMEKLERLLAYLDAHIVQHPAE
ncbi:AaceriABR231Wp [[Ashbya] aceris (nom. inval.)]|nr:AaceriABR231Wp [[Ashbya] aceris (nom. inval.)]